MHTENKIALETIMPDKINDSIKANMNIAIQANSLLLLKKTLYSQTYVPKKRYFTSIYLRCDIN